MLTAEWNESLISKAIIESYHQKLLRSVESNIVIVGAGPAGLTAASLLAAQGRKVTVLEKRLAPGGGVWGGGMGMNQVVVQEEAVPLLDAAGVRHSRCGNLYVVDAVELACTLCLQALHAGAVLLNLTTLEDLCVQRDKVTGVVVNRTTISGALPVDPIVLRADVVIDGSGHEAVAVDRLRARNLLPPHLTSRSCEGPMDAAAGEAFVVEHAGEVYSGLWVTGMAVCATFGGPRMGPIFGGMLLSGKRVAERILAQ
ncbi:MAG TPA: sulfide-dependent adenosine diphosphate thiazole synthase [Bryobacteraceae bacterium]|nr:sulfide-dependent adenosine diphosphate thiazole synthase [Bryobacteraceae bacterium]